MQIEQMTSRKEMQVARRPLSSSQQATSLLSGFLNSLAIFQALSQAHWSFSGGQQPSNRSAPYPLLCARGKWSSTRVIWWLLDEWAGFTRHSTVASSEWCSSLKLTQLIRRLSTQALCEKRFWRPLKVSHKSALFDDHRIVFFGLHDSLLVCVVTVYHTHF